jgi:hypothetical protein
MKPARPGSPAAGSTAAPQSVGAGRNDLSGGKFASRHILKYGIAEIPNPSLRAQIRFRHGVNTPWQRRWHPA